MPTLGLVANVYNEIHALPGWLETHLPYFDDVRIYHSGPQGELSTDGTRELLRDWRIPVLIGAIDEGFGVVRTKAVRSSPCDYVMILDADERFYPLHRHLSCQGESTPQAEVDTILQSYDFHDVRTVLPNWENVAKLGAKLTVTAGEVFAQGAALRRILEEYQPDAVVTSRRHWHDFTFKRPTQNWQTDPDWQMRIVRNSPEICYNPGTRMHEQLTGAASVFRMLPTEQLYFDHFHFSFKMREVVQRAHDIAIYDAIHAGRTPPSEREHYVKGS